MEIGKLTWSKYGQIKMTECPNHGGNFDCTPFCRICEGEQEYKSNGYLPCNRFGDCGEYVEEDIWHEELGFCVECSNLYFGHEIDPFTLEKI
jgi:hypothetical protein